MCVSFSEFTKYLQNFELNYLFNYEENVLKFLNPKNKLK